MSFITTFLTIAATALVTAVATAYSQHISTQRIDKERSNQRRYAAGVMIQAELVRWHMDLKEHSRQMEGYILRTTRVGATQETDFPKFETRDGFPIFHGLMSDVGLFESELSHQIAYGYFNCERFLASQRAFIRDLPTRLNTSMLSSLAKDLAARETALMSQIARIIPLIAQQSKAIPFDPAVG